MGVEHLGVQCEIILISYGVFEALVLLVSVTTVSLS